MKNKKKELTRQEIHVEDTVSIAAVKSTLDTHIKKSNNHDRTIDKKLKDIQSILNTWTPYIQDGMQKSAAYKLVSEDLRIKSKNWKWWFGFAGGLFTVMYGIYWLLERTHFVR